MVTSCWHLLDRAAWLYGSAVAVRDGNGLRWTYAELRDRSLSIAAEISSVAEPGERVAVLDHNTPDFLATYFGAAAAGVVLVPLNHRLHPEETAGILRHADAQAVLHGPALTDRAVALGGALDGAWPLRNLADLPPAAFAPRPSNRRDDPAHLYYTSGTTGAPKGVALTHGNVTTHALAAVAELGLSSADTWAHIAPLFHLADAWATFAITWVGGCHLTLDRFTAPAALDALEDGTTITNLVPTMLNLMVAHPGARERDWSHLRAILSGGAPIAPEVVRAIVDTFGCTYVQTYGMTETSPYLTLSLLDRSQQRLPDSDRLRIASRTGRPFLTVELRVVDETGAPVAADDGAVGEIQVRGPTVTPGYWNAPQATAEAFTDDGFLRTGDLATVDAQGSVQIVDRKKDVILTGGETVYSIEIENVLYRHPAVLEAAVLGTPDPQWGEAIAATVVLRPGHGADEADLQAFCRQQLAAYKVPKSIRFVDALPRTGSGKIAKRMLREPPPR